MQSSKMSRNLQILTYKYSQTKQTISLFFNVFSSTQNFVENQLPNLQGRILGPGALQASAPGSLKGHQKKKERKGKEKEKKERKKGKKKKSNMTNRAPFKHKQGCSGGAPGKKTSVAPNWRQRRRVGEGVGCHSSTLLQGAKINDSLICNLLDMPMIFRGFHPNRKQKTKNKNCRLQTNFAWAHHICFHYFKKK